VTADVLTTDDPRWDLHETVHFIALGPEWPGEVRQLWAGVTVEAHDLAHPAPVAGCPACPQLGTCRGCDLPLPVCPDPVGHDREWRGSETSLLVGSALCPKPGDVR
jgi:hypothetical protein